MEKVWERVMQSQGCFTQGMVACIILALFLLSSCATKIEYRDRDVNHYITKEVHDTLREHTSDSVFEKIYVRGDTVFRTKYVEKTRWKDRIVEKHDTCWRDSVATEYKEITKEVVKYPKTYWWFLGISIISIIFAFVKLNKWLRII